MVDVFIMPYEFDTVYHPRFISNINNMMKLSENGFNFNSPVIAQCKLTCSHRRLNFPTLNHRIAFVFMMFYNLRQFISKIQNTKTTRKSSFCYAFISLKLIPRNQVFKHEKKKYQS